MNFEPNLLVCFGPKAVQKGISALPPKAAAAVHPRKVMLRKVLQRTHRGIQYVEHTDGDGGEMFKAVCKTWLKGTKSKSPSLQ